ncbi:MAG: hypothetical protein WA776_18475 [Xanthobacteraceae bacterium]
MHKIFLTAFAAAALFTIAMPATRAAAKAVATPSTVTISPRVHEAAIICGGNGCNPVHTKSDKRRQYKPLGYTKPVQHS